VNKYTYAIYKLALNFIFDRIHERFFARPTLPVRHLDVSLVATTLDDSLPGRFATWTFTPLDVSTPAGASTPLTGGSRMLPGKSWGE